MTQVPRRSRKVAPEPASSVPSPTGWRRDDGVLPDEGRLAPFDGATAWLNSEPLTPEGLRGRVVLVDFWTYTCVNWLRTLPYVRAWASKYEDAGLTVVGVHTPEFGFESDIDNVVAQTRNLGVEYPVAVDSGYRVWGAFANRFWPAIYIADAEGRIRHHHFGEGEYPQTEMVIQTAPARRRGRGISTWISWRSSLADSRSPLTGSRCDHPRPTSGTSRAAASRRRESRRSTSRTSTPRPPGCPSTPGICRETGPSPGTPPARTRPAPGSRSSSTPAISTSSWARGSRAPSSRSGSPLDGHAAGDAHGTDVDSDGRGVVRDQNTYQLIRQPGPITDRRFEIEFLDAGAEVYCFTFG